MRKKLKHNEGVSDASDRVPTIIETTLDVDNNGKVYTKSVRCFGYGSIRRILKHGVRR